MSQSTYLIKIMQKAYGSVKEKCNYTGTVLYYTGTLFIIAPVGKS